MTTTRVLPQGTTPMTVRWVEVEDGRGALTTVSGYELLTDCTLTDAAEFVRGEPIDVRI